MKRLSWPLAMLGLLSLAAGCSKHLPSPDLTFDTTQEVVVTFRSGEEIEGKIDRGKKIEFREPGLIWSARVAEITEEKIVLRDLTQVRETANVLMQRARLGDARVTVAEPLRDKTLLRSDITQVEVVRFDAGRTAQQSSFWALGAAVLALLLGERS